MTSLYCLCLRCIKRPLMEYQMQYLEEQILSWKYMAWRVFLKKTWMREEEHWSKRTKVERERMPSVLPCSFLFQMIIMLVTISRNTKEKAKPGWFWWLWRGWRAWPLLSAAWVRPAPGKLCSPYGPAWHAPWLWCSRDPTKRLLRWDITWL